MTEQKTIKDLKVLRKKLDLKQTDLADELLISKSTYIALEKYHQLPNRPATRNHIISQLKERFDIDVSDLPAGLVKDRNKAKSQ